MSNANIKDITSIRVIYNDSRPNTWLRLTHTITRFEASNIASMIKSNPDVMTVECGTSGGTHI